MVQIILICTLLMLFCSNALAAPTISTVSGTLSQGQSITVTGSGFGSKSTASPQLWDTVENISSYSSVSDGATVPTGGSYLWSENYDSGLKMETTDSMRTTLSSKMYKSVASKGALKRDVTNTGKIYLSYWWKPSGDPNANSSNHSSKFLRISHTLDEGMETFSWTQKEAYVYYHGWCAPEVWQSYDGVANQWNFHEIFIDGVNRTFTIYVNGTITSQQNWSTYCAAYDFDQVNGIGWDPGGTSPPVIDTWMDDIYVDNTAQRVMMCSGSTWSNRGHCEMQIPSSWSTSSITAVVNRGSFGATDSVYLYVVDSANTANSGGYSVTLGSGESDTTPPTVTAFTIPSTSTSLTVDITTFTATDAVGVTGYKLTESATAPGAGDAGWTGTVPTSYTFSTEGSKTLYAWAKDAAGNVSTSLNDSVTITLPPPILSKLSGGSISGGSIR